MKIVYNIFVKVRKLWDAIFGRNGDGSEVKLAGTIDGASGQVELGEGLSLDGNTLSAEAGGTEVEPLSSVTGSEPTFRGLKIDGTDYQVYRQPVDANVGHTSSAPDLQDVLIGDTVYKIPAGAYIATKSDITHISAESLNYIVANYLTTPCYIIATSSIGLVTEVDSATIIADGGLSTNTGTSIIWKKVIKINRNTRLISQFTVAVSPVSATGSGGISPYLVSLTVSGSTYNIRDGQNHGLGYLTTAPSSANTDGIKIVVLSAEPATKYAGYLYIITA